MWHAIAVAFIIIASMVAHAQEVEVATGLICDTQKQIERFAELYPSENLSAIKTINNEEKTFACAIAGVAFIRGDVVARVEIENASYSVTSIIVVAAKTDNGWVQGPPIKQFILLKDAGKNI